MKTILFGNGLNRLNGYSTWEDLLKKIDDSQDDVRIPNTMQYEAEVLPLPEKSPTSLKYDGDSITYNGKILTYGLNTETNLKTEIATAMASYETNDVYRHLATLPDVPHLVTTNYDEVMKQTLLDMGYVETEHVKSENIYSIRRRVTMSHEDEQKYIWNMHGEISAPRTIMLGLHQYCGSVGQINDYLNGKYTYIKDKKEQTLPSMRDRLHDGIEQPFSWIDLFFLSDIFFIGFGLLYEEIDLWWILTRRKRMIRQGADLHNRVYYCGKVPPGKRQLFTSMDVEVLEPDPKVRGYGEQYHSTLEMIEEMR